jgi:hypothetical protein
MSRLNGILGLLIGIFGALAILGVFFKIAKTPGVDYELFMAVGFMGEAGAFIIMGIFALINGFTMKSDGEDARGVMPSMSGSALPDEVMNEFRAALAETAEEFREALQASSGSFGESMQAASTEFRASVRQTLDDRLGDDLGVMVEGVGEDVRHFGVEMRGLGDEMQQARSAVQSMRKELDRVAMGSLPEDAERLGIGMRQLGEGMAEAGATVDRMRDELNEMASRFSAFNHGKTTANGDGSHVFGVPVASKRDRSEAA